MKNILYSFILLFCLWCIPGIIWAQNTANPDVHTSWQVDPPDYQYNMIITAVIDIEGEESIDPDDKVAVFIAGTNNIRGVASPSYVQPLDRYVLSLFVYSTNGVPEPLEFYVYDASTDLVLPCLNSEVFGINKLIGSFVDPYVISTIRIEANFTKDDVLCIADNFGYVKANVTGGTPPYTYLWSTGATTDSLAGLTAGQYYLTITDANNYFKVDSIEIENLERPILSPVLTVAPDEIVCEGDDVYMFAFSAETENPIYEWYDDFGNFVQSDEALYLPDIGFSQGYQVQTNVRNCLSPFSDVDVAVNAVPDPSFGVSNFEPTPNIPIVFTPASSDEPVTFNWAFGDGNFSTNTIPTHQYAAAGNYLVTLTITTAEGCSAIAQQFISVDEREIDILVEKNDPDCLGDDSGAISVQALNGAPPYEYEWNTGATTSDITDLIAGTYTLTVTDGEGNTGETSIVLDPGSDLPLPEVVINGNLSICAGDEILLQAFNLGENFTYRWYNDANAVQLISTNDQLQLFGLSSDRTIWVETVKGNCTSALQQIDIDVSASNAAFSVNNAAIPLGVSVTFTADNVVAGNVYSWDFGDGTTLNGAGPINHTYNVAGTFEVQLTVLSPDGCVSRTTQFVNVWGDAIQLIPNVVAADCAGNASGTIALQVINGQPPYAYQWSTGSALAQIEDLLPGTYSVTVQDNIGATATAQITVGAAGDAPDTPTLIINEGNVVCAGDDLWINAYSDNADVVFYWYTSAIDPNPIHIGNTLFLFDVQESDFYFVESRVGDCVSPRTSVNVQIVEPNASFTTSMEVTFVSQAIAFQVSSPAFGFEYTWDWGDNTANSNLTSIQHTFDAPGIYEVSLTARSILTGCTDVQVIRIQIVDLPDGGSGNDTPLSSLPLAEPAQCEDSPTGQLSAFAFGGTPPYSYLWSNGSSAPYQTDILPGTYFLTVTDGQGNESVGSATVGVLQDIPDPSAIISGGQTVCLGEEVQIGVSSDAAGVSYLWFNNPSDIGPIYTGASITLNADENLDTIYLLASLSGCFSELVPIALDYGVADAGFDINLPTAEVGQTINFTADSISAAYEYFWDFGDNEEGSGATTTHEFDQEGLYEAILTVFTEDGCSASQRRFINIYEPTPEALSLTFVHNHPHCPEDETGGITALVIGGQGPFTYLWSNGETSESLLAIGTGIYGLTVTDALGQMVENTTQLMSLQATLDAPNVTLAGAGVVCEGGSAWLAATGEIPGTQYYWYETAFGGSPIFTGSYLELNNVNVVQAYFVEAQYEGCVSQDRTPVFVDVETADADFTASAMIVPVNTAIDFNAAGPASQEYLWEFGDGASATSSSTNYTYTSPGLYAVSLTAITENGCEEKQSKWIEVQTLEALALSVSVTNSSCFDSPDGSISIEILGGLPPYNIIWSTGDTGLELSNLTPGIYICDLSDQGGNSISQEIEIQAETPELIMEEVSISGVGSTCPGENIILIATANVTGAEYRWYDAATGGDLVYVGASFPTIVLENNTIYFVEAANGACITAQRTEITVEASGPNATYAVSPDPLTAGQEATFVPNIQDAGSTYFWNFGDDNTSTQQSPTHTYVTDGVYITSLTVRDALGCELTQQQAVTVGFGLTLGVLIQTTDMQCAGDDTGACLAQVVNGVPPYTYAWSNGENTEIIQGLTAGVYEVTITDANNATATAQTEVVSIIEEIPSPQVTANNDIICPDEYIILYAFDNTGTASNYYWYNSSNGGTLLGAGSTYSQQGLISDTQTFYVEAAKGACRSMERTAITIEEDSPNAGFTATANTIIEGNTVSFTPLLIDNSYTYQWFFGDGGVSAAISPTYTYMEPGQYNVVLSVTSDMGCVEAVQEIAFIEVIPEGVLSVLFDTEQIECEGDNTGSIEVEVLNGVPPYEYAWNTGANTNALYNLSTGTYQVTVTDNEGNSTVSTVQIEPIFDTPNAPTVSPNDATTLCNSETVVLTASSGDLVDQYYWYSGGSFLSTGISIVITPEQATLPIEVQGQSGSCFSNLTSLNYEVELVNASFSTNLTEDPFVGTVISFSPALNGYESYEWTFGDGSVSTEESPQHIYDQEGQFEVSLQVISAAGCSDTYSITINVIEANELLIAFDVEDVWCDESEEGSIIATPIGGTPPYTYLWEDGSTSNEISNLPAGTYALTLTDNQDNEITSQAVVQNLDVQIPIPETMANGGAPVCKGEPAFLSATLDQYPQATMYWYESMGAVTPLEDNDILLLPALSEDQTYYIEAEVQSCHSERSPAVVNVQVPNVAFDISPGTLLEEGDLVQFIPEESTAGNMYYWDFGDNGWSTAMLPYYFYNLPGTFDVSLEVVDADGCSDELVKTSWITVEAYNPFNDEDIEERKVLSGSSGIDGMLYPNPFSDYFTAILRVDQEGWYAVELIDAFGRTLIQDRLYLNNDVANWTLDSGAASLQAGAYYLRIYGEGEVAIAKLIKQ